MDSKANQHRVNYEPRMFSSQQFTPLQGYYEVPQRQGFLYQQRQYPVTGPQSHVQAIYPQLPYTFPSQEPTAPLLEQCAPPSAPPLTE